MASPLFVFYHLKITLRKSKNNDNKGRLPGLGNLDELSTTLDIGLLGHWI